MLPRRDATRSQYICTMMELSLDNVKGYEKALRIFAFHRRIFRVTITAKTWHESVVALVNLNTTRFLFETFIAGVVGRQRRQVGIVAVVREQGPEVVLAWIDLQSREYTRTVLLPVTFLLNTTLT